ncbi:hypothetical protein ACFONG_18870 [Uliginosibacterium paludis]|uniref:DUF883 domain-containing protein n=1 Tax=Uliginosibacterium paludis TaxID=1615952 RepID=A0ABV2CT47_9RHOO
MASEDQGTMKSSSGMTGTSHEAVDRAAAGAHQLVDKVAPAVDKVQSTLSGASEAVSSGMAGFEDARQRWMESCRTCVTQHPLTSIALAAALGYVLSCLRRR